MGVYQNAYFTLCNPLKVDKVSIKDSQGYYMKIIIKEKIF